MSDKGFLRRALSPDGKVRLVAVDVTPVLQNLLQQCKLYPPSAVHVGQGAMGALMLQALADTDQEDKVECQWRGSGLFGLYADALGTGKIRVSITNPRIEIPTLKEGLGKGLFQVRKVRAGQETSTGIVESSGHVGEDLATSLEQSEQRKTGVSLSVKLKTLENPQENELPFFVEKAVGYLVDVLGHLSVEQQEQTLAWWQAQMDVLGSLSEWALDDNPEIATAQMLRMLTMKEHLRFTLETTVESFCTCSLEKAIRAIKLLNTNEQHSLVEKNSDVVVVNCEYCGASYSVDVSTFAVGDAS